MRNQVWGMRRMGTTLNVVGSDRQVAMITEAEGE
jgi:hypothetical protein